jgi:hypothetical protein
MNIKSGHLHRRTVLKGLGVIIPLPLFDSMLWADVAEAPAAKKRFCTFYFPFGVPVTPEGHPHENWNWFPREEKDGSYQFREIMKPLIGLKSHVTVFQGLHHVRESGGHNSADGFLTGTPISGQGGKGTISVDQVVAEKYGDQTRLSSLVLGLDGGIGSPARSHTLSYGRDGMAIPAESNVRRIFDSMFSEATQRELIAQLKKKGSILDQVMESAKNLSGEIGKRDQEKLDEYLSSIRQLEKRIQKQEAWLANKPPDVDASTFAIDATMESPKDYLQSMFDLVFLAFQTDMTRASTFQIGNQDASGMTAKLTSRLGMKGAQHALAHAMNKDDGAANYGEYLQILTGFYAGFLERLKNTKEGPGTMLDNTLAFFGSSNSNGTHSSINLPLILAGGEGMGIKQGQYIKVQKGIPLGNLYATMLDRLGVPQKSFAGSTGLIREIMKA